MRRPGGLVVMMALLLAAIPAAASRACPDLLLGDSLAVGMARHAREAGFQVIAQGGAGIAWLRQQPPRCARRLVLVFGTNDLRGMTAEDADAYLHQIAAVMERWPANRIVWATPGCFRRDAQLEQGSTALDRVLAARRHQAGADLRHLPAINRGREARCAYASADGVHPTAEFYRDWWVALMRVLDRRRLADAGH
jgi:hypothetical protein